MILYHGSNIYSALLRPTSGLYAQSSGYVFSLLENELKNIQPLTQSTDTISRKY